MNKSICGTCKKENRIPDCGANIKDYEVKKGIGVINCKEYESR